MVWRTRFLQGWREGGRFYPTRELRIEVRAATREGADFAGACLLAPLIERRHGPDLLLVYARRLRVVPRVQGDTRGHRPSRAPWMAGSYRAPCRAYAPPESDPSARYRAMVSDASPWLVGPDSAWARGRIGGTWATRRWHRRYRWDGRLVNACSPMEI